MEIKIMKRWTVLIGIVVVIIAVVLIFFPTGRKHITKTGRTVVEVLSLQTGKEYPLASMVPFRAGFFIQAHGISDAWEEFTGSDFFRNLTSSNLWEEAKIDEKLENFREEFKDRNGFEINRSRLMELAGKDIALAILPADDISPDAFLIISRIGLKVRLVEILARLGDSLQDEGKRALREEEYREKKIFLFRPTDSFPFFGAYTFIDNYLVVAFAQNPVRPVIEQVIDLVREEKEGDALADSPLFTEAGREVAFPSGTFLEWYFRPSRFRSRGEDNAVSSFSTSGMFSMMEWREEIVKRFSAVRTIAARVGYTGGIRSRIVLTLENEITGSAHADSGIFRGYLFPGALLFAEFGSDLSLLWEKVTTVVDYLAGQGYVAPLIGLRNWERETGLSIKEDILPILEDQCALVMEEITGQEFLPLPPFALIFRIGDRKKADEVMGRVAAWAAVSHNLTPVREEYGGTEMTLLPIDSLFFVFVQPGYAIVESDLIIGSSRDLLMKMIDLRNRVERGTETDRYYQEITAVIAPDRGDFIYLNGERLIQSLIHLGDWYMAYQKIAPIEPRLPEEIYREKIIPLLHLCGICKAAGISVTRDKNVVKEDCFIYIQ